MKKSLFLRIMAAWMIVAVLALFSGCNKNKEIPSGEEEPKTENSQDLQSDAEIGGETANNSDVNAPIGGVGTSSGGSSDIVGFESDDPNQAVSSDGTVSNGNTPPQGGNTSGESAAGSAGGATEEGNTEATENTGNSETPNGGTAETVQGDNGEEQEDPSEPEVTYDETAAKEYENYLAMDAKGREAYYKSFPTPADFRAWKETAQAAYEAKQNANKVSGGSLNLHDYIKKDS